MLSWPPTVRIFVCSDATDMRKGFDSIAYLVESSLALDPFSGHLFFFRSRRGDRIKILYWDAGGYVLWYKRLEKGTFRFPTVVAQATGHVEIKAADLATIFDGVDLASVRRQRHYSRESAEIPGKAPFRSPARL
jgi:transposase